MTTAELIAQAIAYLQGAGYTLTRHPAGYWLVSGPASPRGHCPGGTLRLEDACLIRIARTIRGERLC